MLADADSTQLPMFSGADDDEIDGGTFATVGSLADFLAAKLAG